MGPASQALVGDLDLRDALEKLRGRGAAFLGKALQESFRERVLKEVAQGDFERLPAQIGPVRQETDLLLIRKDFGRWPAVAELRSELVETLRAQVSHIPGMPQWEPNEAYVQRYRTGALGVSPHVDSKRFVILVAVFTLAGSATFSLCTDRYGNALEEWEAESGSLVLLRAPGFDGSEDGRPFHRVQGPLSGERHSLTFRMNERDE